jgi:hypothetical protein
MQKIILALVTMAGALTLGGCAYPDHSGVYQDQHNGRQEQSHDDRYDHRNDGYRDGNHDDHDDNYVDPRRQ